MTRILLTHPLPFQGDEKFPQEWDVRCVGEKGVFDRDAVMQHLADCDGLLCFLTDPVDREIIDQGSGLKIIANAGVGFNNIDWRYARERGIVVTNTPDVLTEATADLTLALMLGSGRRLLEADRFVRQGRFRGWDLELMLGLEMCGATLGIVGMGRIGQAVARRARAFGMSIIYHNRNSVDPEIERELGACRVSLPELLSRSDVVSLHCPLTDDTHHLIGENEFDRMKPGAILVNTARGPVVDENALVQALKSGRIRAAGLDVYEDEPVVHPRLLELDNVLLLPHIGSATEKTRQAIVHMAVDNLLRYFSEGKPLTPVF